MTAQDSLTEALSVSIIASQLENLPESAPARRDIWSVIIDKVTSDTQSLQVSLHGTANSSWWKSESLEGWHTGLVLAVVHANWKFFASKDKKYLRTNIWVVSEIEENYEIFLVPLVLRFV